MNQRMMIGLDLATSVFQVHDVDAPGNPVLKKRITRAQRGRAIALCELRGCWKIPWRAS